MADEKLTERTELTAPADGDYVHIVDVSDTTDDAAGTSKKIKKSNLTKKRYVDLTDATDDSYVGKYGFVPMAYPPVVVDVPEGGYLKLTKVPTFQDLYGGNAVISGGIVHLSGLTYYVWASSFIINGVKYDEFVSEEITLSDGDATDPRIDVIAIEVDVDAYTFDILVIEGTPASSPVKPTVDLEDQVEVTFRTVLANETTDPDIDEELVYNENLGESSEWDNSFLLSTGNLAATDDPYDGTYYIEAIAGSSAADPRVVFDNDSLITWDGDTKLVFALKTDGGWNGGNIQLKVINSSSSAYNILTINSSNSLDYGFDDSVTDWQLVVVSFSSFTSPSSPLTQYDRLEFKINGLLYVDLDYIRFQSGLPTSPQDDVMLKGVYDPAGKQEQVLTESDLLDEDDFASDSDTKGATQQSIKAYINSNSVDSDFTVTVGSGGDYSTINEALEYLSTLNPLYVNEGFSATINLLTGFTMDEQVIISNGIDFSWVKITSDDAEVPIARSSLTVFTDDITEFNNIQNFAGSFMATNSARLPRIATVFAQDTSGTASDLFVGIFISRGATAYVEEDCGIHDTDGSGAIVMYNASLIAPNSLWDGNGREQDTLQLAAVKSQYHGHVDLQEATIQNQVGYGCLIIGGSTSSIRGLTIDNCAEYGLLGGSVSIIHAREVDIQNCGVGIYADEGCLVRLIQSNISNNDGNGIFIGGASIVNSAVGTTINNNGSNGVRVTGGGTFSITTPEITGNTLDGVLVEDGQATISGGEISGNGGDDIAANGPMSIIRLDGSITTTSGSSAANNLADSNVSVFNTFSRSGTGGIFGKGGRYANRGTASISSGNTVTTVSHGLGFTPLAQEINVTPTNDMGNANKFWVNGVTSTQFAINVDGAPTTKSANFGWNVSLMFG